MPLCSSILMLEQRISMSGTPVQCEVTLNGSSNSATSGANEEFHYAEPLGIKGEPAPHIAD